MTIVVALKDTDGVVHLGTDSRLTSGNHISETRRPKWVKYDRFVIAVAGDWRCHNILEELRTVKDFRSLPANNRKDINVIIGILREYMQGLDLLNEGADGRIENHMILATRHTIYHIGSNLCWMDSGDLEAIGCGREYALGTMWAMNNAERSHHPKGDIQLALEAACKFDAGCGGALHIKSFDEIRNR